MTTEASCHCGAIRFEVESPPATVTDCNCSICRRNGVLWAHYSPTQVRFVAGENTTDVYMWGDRTLGLHRCKVCGCVAYWVPVDKALDRMGVNANLMDPAVLAAARVRKLDGADTWKYLGED